MNLLRLPTLSQAALTVALTALCFTAGCATHADDQDAYWRHQNELGGSSAVFASSPTWSSSDVVNTAPSKDDSIKKFDRRTP